MTTVTLRIQVDKAGASQGIAETKRDLSGLGQAGQSAGQQASGGMNALRSSIDSARAAVGTFIAVYAGIQALSGVVRLADEYNSLNDRLRLATDSSAEFTAAQQGVFAIAQETGTALGATTTLYTRLAQSTDALGLSQSQLLTITEAINQSFVVSGAGAGETDAAIRQLAQGFASGALRGDEFNSVMENAPRLAKALADSLGVTVGELRNMAAEGKLTSDVLARGLLQQAPAIAGEFDQMGTTVGRAFTQLSNSVLKFVGEADQASGASRALAGLIVGLANNLPIVASALLAVAGGYAAVTAAAALANPALTLTGAIVGRLALGVGVLIAAFASYQLGKYLADQFEVVRVAGAALVVGLNNVWNSLKSGAIAVFTAIRVAWFTIIDQIQERAADLLQAFLNISQVELPFGLRADFTYGAEQSLRDLITTLRTATDATTEHDRALGQLRDQLDFAADDTQAFSDDMFDAATANRNLVEATNATTGAANALRPALTAVATAGRDAAAGANAARGAFAGATGAAGALAGAATTARGSVDGFRGAIASGTQAAQDFGVGMGEVGRQAQDFGINWGFVIDDITQAFGDFVASGLRSFEDFAQSLKNIAKRIVSDLVSTFLRNRIVIPITAALTGSGSAAAGPLGGLTGGGGGILGTLGSVFGGIFGGEGLIAGGVGALASGVGSLALSTGSGLLGSIAGGLGSLASVAGPIGAALAGIYALTQLFRSKKPPDLRFGGTAASVRSEEGRFSTVFGTVRAGSRQLSYQELIEPIQQFDAGIAGLVETFGLGQQQLDAISQAVSRWSVDLRGDAATAENVLGSRFSAILTAFNADVQSFVGSAGTVEQRVQRLGDALTIAAIAAGDNGITGSFTELAELLTEFREGAESLGDTFQRISGALTLVDGALTLVGGQFGGTRLEAAAFSAELVRLSGGFDAFAQRLQGALNALFTEGERNQFLADQARLALNQGLQGLGIEATGTDAVRTALREQLRAALEGGNAELVNQILTVANALGAFTTALEALGEDAIAAAQGVTFGGQAPAGGQSSGATPIAAPTTQLQVQTLTNEYIQRGNSLLEEIAANTRPVGDEVGGQKALKDTGSNTRAMRDLLADILRTLQQEQQATTQIALKRTVGVNGAKP